MKTKMKMIIIVTLLVVPVVGVTILFDELSNKAIEYTSLKKDLMIERSSFHSNITQTREELTEAMLSKLAQKEWGEYERGDGKLRYANDPTQARRGQCQRIGGARNINCDSWTVFQWKIPTAQMFYKKLYGYNISEIDMLVKLHDKDFLYEFTARTILENEGAIWHWTTANNNRDYFSVVINTIRKLDK